MKKLVIITKKFPYFQTEAFIESEYIYYDNYFEKVTFLPIIKGKLREKCKDANICDAYNELYKTKYVQVFKMFFSCHFYKAIVANRKKICSKNFLLKIIFQEIHYRILKNLISKNESLFDENTVVYSYWFSSVVYALLKVREENLYKYKVVCRAHRFDVYDDNGEMPNRKYCIKNLDKIFPISQDALNVLSKQSNNIDKFSLSRLGVHDYKCISKQSKNGDYNILTVSQTSKRKRLLLIWESIQQYAILNPQINVKWTHIGDGPLDDELQRLSNNNRVSNYEITLKGRVPNSCVLDYYTTREIDVFMNLSSSEGVPVSVMEAQSFGIPVIATDVGGSSEIVDDTNGCLLCANPTVNDVVKALEKIKTGCFDRKEIKEVWKNKSNAEVVFPYFISELAKI